VPVTPDALDGLLLIASELCSNAVRHATPGPGAVTLHACVDSDGVVLEVTDNGGELDLPTLEHPALPDPEAEQGRGLFLVRELADSISCDVHEGRTVVIAIKRAVIGD
jgi:serine/threonine-protein kinase RsbW